MSIDPPFLPKSADGELDTEWHCPDDKCDYAVQGKWDFALGNGMCEQHGRRLEWGDRGQTGR